MLLHDPAALELLEPRGQDVRADPGQAAGQVGVALGAVEELTDDEKRPALSDETKGVRHRAVLVVALAHARSVARGLAVVKDGLAKSK